PLTCEDEGRGNNGTADPSWTQERAEASAPPSTHRRSSMRSIVIIGGHGKVALHLARQLTERGDRVTSLIRNPEHQSDVADTGATPVVLDVEQTDVDSLATVLGGHDAVVWSAGAGGGDPERTKAVDRDAAMASMDA